MLASFQHFHPSELPRALLVQATIPLAKAILGLEMFVVVEHTHCLISPRQKFRFKKF